MGASCFWNNHVPSVDAAEAVAAVQALRFAKDMGFRQIELEGDSSTIISKLKTTSIDRSEIGPHIWEARILLTMFEKVKYQHIKREGNRVAHLIAKEGFLR